MAYVPEMKYSPEMGKLKIKVGKKVFKKIAGAVSKVASVVPLPQTQLVSAVTKVASKVKSVTKGSKKSPTEEITTNTVMPTPQDIIPSDKKILGLEF